MEENLMSETKEKNTILNNLSYIGLDLKNIPNSLMEYKDVDYKPTRAYEQTDFRNSITEKYSKALPLCEYLNNKEEKDIINHAIFLKMLEGLNKKEIEKID